MSYEMHGVDKSWSILRIFREIVAIALRSCGDFPIVHVGVSCKFEQTRTRNKRILRAPEHEKAEILMEPSGKTSPTH